MYNVNMKRRMLWGLLGLFLVFTFTLKHASASVQDFTINSFDAEYVLTKNPDGVGSIDVTEEIEAEFPSYDQNHGIERAIPKTYKNQSLNLKVKSVTKLDGTAWNYSTRTQNDNLVLRIGNANSYVHGTQQYIITYTMENVITFFDDHDEWFWDVNGDQWSQPFLQTSATILMDNSLSSQINKQPVCYTGSFGSTNKNCVVITTTKDGKSGYNITATGKLNPAETLSFAVGFNTGTFNKAPINWWYVAKIVLFMALVVVPPLVAAFIAIRNWRAHGRDPKGRGLIVPEYKPPKDMNSLLATVILNEKLNTKALSATIIELSVNKYCKIYETSKKHLVGSSEDYELELLKPTNDLPEETQKVVSSLFGNTTAGTRVKLSDKKNKLYTTYKSIDTLVDKKVEASGYFIRSPRAARKQYMMVGLGLVVISLFALVPTFGAASGLTIAGLILLIVGNRMPARTVRGVEVKEHLLGLQEYMKLAEADRIKTLQGPNTAVKQSAGSAEKQYLHLYEKLLPYAIIFGIEKEWTKVIGPLYDEQPDWYSSSRPFNAVLLTNAVSSVSTATANSFSSPSSSGSGGFSGGGAGGGGGGGGGGGW